MKFQSKKIDLTASALGLKANAVDNVEIIKSILEPRMRDMQSELVSSVNKQVEVINTSVSHLEKASNVSAIAINEMRAQMERIEKAPKGGGDVNMETLKEAIAHGIGDLLEPMVTHVLSQKTPMEVIVKQVEKADVHVDTCHYNFDKLIKMAGARLNVALIGEAGSGKTHGAQQCAEVLGLQHYTISFHAKMTSTDLRGYMDAIGKYNESALYTAFKNGGVLILDEFDRANTEVVVSLNNLLAGRSYLFPNGENVAKHDDLIIIACQNTTGSGASKQYAAASRQDASTLNRFVKLAWDVDECLEIAIAGDTEATREVQRIRRKARDLGMDMVISPRQAIHANTLMGVGFTLDEALQYSIFECLAEDQILRLKNI